MPTSCERREIDRFSRRSLLKNSSAAVSAFALPGLLRLNEGQAVADPLQGRRAAAAQQAIVDRLKNKQLGFFLINFKLAWIF